MVEDGLASLPRGTDDDRWPWPEPRLAYGNALLPEALIAAGTAVGDDVAVQEGLRLLRWLVDGETLDGHLSFTPAAGRGPDDARPAFDQQPIEAGVLADACARAFAVTSDEAGSTPLRSCVGWFEGRTTPASRCSIRRPAGRFDGLESDGVNQNQGAESTIAFVATMQHASAWGDVGTRSAGGAERGQQLILRDHRGADASIGRSVREVDHAVLTPMGPLDEHHVVDVAGAFPGGSGSSRGSGSFEIM